MKLKRSVFVAFMLLLAACGVKTTAGQTSTTTATTTTTPALKRIVSLSPTATEMLFAIGAGPQVVAVDDQSNFPANTPKTDLSGFTPNAEAIAKYTPDLVVVSDDSKIKDAMTTLKIAVAVEPAAVTIDDTYKQIAELGQLTGHAADADAVVMKMKADIQTAVASAPKLAKPLTYYYELDNTYYTVTSKTFVGSLIAQLGLSNIADDSDPSGSGYPQLSAEKIVKANPNVIFLADTKCCQQDAAAVGARPGWKAITAVTTGGVVGLDDDIASRWGPRVVDLLQTIVSHLPKA